MDDLIRLIVFAFIIFFIFGSLFRKKNQPQNQKKFPPDKSEEATKSSSDSSTEILHDLFGIPLPKTGGEYENSPRQSFPSRIEASASKAESFNMIEAVPGVDINYDKLPSLEKQTNLYVEQAAEPQKAYEVGLTFNNRTVELKRKIKNPISLRELYLISEIINKPKALRR